MSDRLGRRDFLQVIGGTALVSVLGRPALAAEPLLVRFGVIGIPNGLGSLFHLVAEKNGTFEKHGISLKILGVGHGGPELVAAAASGQVDLGSVGTPILSAIAGGAPLKVVGAPAYKKQPFVLVVRPDIKTFADLKNQTVSVGSVGGGGDQALAFMLKANNLGPAEVRKVLVASGNGDFAALKSGRIAGAIMSEPTVSQTVAQGDGRVLARGVDYYGHYEHSYVFASDRFIAEHPGAIRAYFAANREAILYAKANQAELLAFGVSKLGLSEPVLKTYLDTYLPLWDESQQVDIEGMLNAITYMKELGYIDQSYTPDVAKIADLRFAGEKA